MFLLSAACGLLGADETPAPPVATLAPAVVPPKETPVAPTATLQPTPTAIVVTAVVTAPAETASEIDFAPLVAFIEQEMATAQVPGMAVAVIHRGVRRFVQGFGLTDVAANSAVTPATIFRIGSITKPLTAIGVMQLVEAGQVDLDAPVIAYLPEFKVNDAITVRQLLSHSSGLGDAAIPFGSTGLSALREYVATLIPASAFAPPGALFSYSNVGFNTLGRIIEVVSGMPYEQYMTTRVFPALEMEHTTFRREVALAEGLALGYYPSRGGPTPVDRDPDNGAEYPSGFAFSSVEDLTRLALFLLSDGMVDGEQRLQPALVQAMKTPAIWVEPLEMGYGLGLSIRTQDGETMIGHNGNIDGYAATIELLPSQELAVIVLSNRNNYETRRIAQAAIDIVLGRSATPPTPPIEVDQATLASYAGRYAMSSALPEQEAEVMTVAQQAGALTASLPGVTFELRPIGTDLFDVYVPDLAEPVTQLAFIRDESGAVHYMSFTMHALIKLAD
jgi:CubicO group peptidase (beta-lactamase class C family)